MIRIPAHQAKAHGIAALPLIIVDQGPMKVCPDIDAVFDAALNTFQCFIDETDPLEIICCCNAVFGHQDLFSEGVMDFADRIF